MRTIILFLTATVAGLAQEPPVQVTPPATQSVARTFEYDQKPAAPRAPLVGQEQAQGIIDRFKEVHAKTGASRIVIYVNRELVDEDAGLKLIARTEKIDATTQNNGETNTVVKEKAQRENRYRRDERKDPALNDRQTVRDVERLFGRPFRMAGVRLADQRLATQMMADRPLQSLATEGEQARKDREALANIADIAIEVLVASKKVDVAELSGNRTYEIPDIQATALRLKDSLIIGQASSSEVMRGHPRNTDVNEVTVAVALALMEDITAEAGK